MEVIKLNFKYKDLKELCKAANVEYKDSTNSRKKIIKELESRYKLVKDGRGYIITEIYDIPKEKVDGRKTGNTGKNPNSHGNNIGGEYTQYVQPLLKNYLSSFKDDLIYVTNTFLGKYCGFITENFISSISYKNISCTILKEKCGINNYYSLWDTTQKINESYKGIIQYNLKKIQEEGYIKFTYNYIFIYNNECYCADAEEIKKIKEIENEILVELELKTKSDLAFCSEKKVKKFYKKFEDEIIKEFEVEGIFQGYGIDIRKPIESEIEDIEIYRKEINNKFQEKIYKNVEKLYDKAFDKMSKFKGITKKEEGRVRDQYLPNCKVVIKELLSCNNTIHLNKLIDKKLKEIEKTKEKVKKIKERDMVEPRIFDGFFASI